MADASSDNPAPRPQREGRYLLPPELVQLLAPSIQVGAGAGAVGLFAGAALGIVRSSPPALFALVTGAQWFALGSSYDASRTAIMNAWGGERNLSPINKVKASTVAGGCAGIVGGLIRGPRNIVPGFIVFSLLGAGGQAVANSWPSAGANSTSKTSWLDSKWSPITRLSDEDYEKTLQEKLLRIEADIALIDDDIQALRAGEKGEIGGKNERGPK